VKKGKKQDDSSTSDSVIYRQLPLLYFLIFLGIVYTFNSFSIEDKRRRITDLKQTHKEEQWRYKSVKADYMFQATKSQVDKRVDGLGLTDDASSIYIIRKEEG